MTEKKPLLTVVIPTYNRNDLLARCLDRLAPGQQTLDPTLYEVLVTDDGSAPTSQPMLREKYPWVQWTAGPRRGPAANRNHAIRQVRTEWIALTDDDCVPSLNWLEVFADAIQTAGRTETIEGRTTCDEGFPSPLLQAPVNVEGGNLYTCNLALTKTTFELVGGFDERFPHAIQEDIEFRERLKRAGYKTRFVPEAVIDHPPRMQHLGKSAGLRWEGKALIDTLVSGKPKPGLAWEALVVRGKEVLAAPFRLETLRFAWSVVVEVAVVAWNTPKWMRKYKGFVPHKALPPID
jgi:GT2 family glycosyltransferase